MPAPALEDLEPTAFPPAPASAEPSSLIAELESTRVEGAEPPGFEELMATLTAALPAERPDDSWIERHIQADAEAEVEALPVERFESAPAIVAVETLEVERTSEPALPKEPELSGPRTCRYCRTPAPLGVVFCDACGMHLES